MNNIKLKGRYKIKTYKNNKLIRETNWIDNLIVSNENHGLYLILNGLLGNETYSLEITKAKIGDDDTAVQDSDTDLVNTVLDDIPVAVRSRKAVDEILITFFIPSGDLADGDYKEFGIFCTDQLFARSIITPTYTKSENEDTQIEYQITATN